MRILLKISGDALKGENNFGVSCSAIEKFSKVIKQAKDENKNLEIGIVIGAGNFFRGRDGDTITRTTADDMGMLATVMNSIALCDGLKKSGIQAEAYSNISIPKMCKTFRVVDAIEDLKKGKVCIFAGGSGNPYFTTDTAAALKCLEIQAEMFLLGKNIDGVYDSDPKTNPNAKKYDKLTYMDVLNQDLKVMDQTAITMCKENNVPIYVFDIMTEPKNLLNAICQNANGTIISK